jgi:pSer/pThr/pTyr-binding forkhead associated (FHA) protein
MEGGRSRILVLDRDRLTIGKAPSNDVALTADGRLSRLHAVLEGFEAGWCIRDLGSRNGTYLNGRRIWDTHPLRPGDEVLVGETTLVFRWPGQDAATGTTDSSLPQPELTRRERDVLLALCRPIVSGDVFTEPASIREVAAELTVTEGAVKQHLAHLYDKFGLYEAAERRRVRLANEALHRGIVTLGDLRNTPGRA